MRSGGVGRRAAAGVLGALAGTLVLGAAPAQAAVTASIGMQPTPEGADVTVTLEREVTDVLGMSQATVTVSPGTADVGGVDVGAPAPATVTWSPGDLAEKTVSVPTVQDALHEAAETFFVTVVSGGTPVAGSPFLATIADDDPEPKVSVGPGGAGKEGSEAAPGQLLVPVQLDAPSGLSSKVKVTLSAADASTPGLTPPAATQGTDFDPVSTEVTIPAGQSAAPAFLPVRGDVLDEGDEQLVATISEPVNAELGTQERQPVTIADDDVPFVAAGIVDLAEGNSGTTAFAFPVALTNPSTRTITATFGTADVTARAGQDYTSVQQTVTFAPGETTGTVTVPVLGDTAAEDAEAFVLEVQAATGAQKPTGPGVGVIRNDDQAPKPPAGLGTLPPAAGGTGSDATQVRVSEVRGSKGRVAARVRCAGAASCVGQVTFFTVRDRRSKVRQLRKERRLGAVDVTVPGGAAKVVSVRLKPADRKLVARARRVRVKSFAVVTDSASGMAAVANATGTVRP